MLPGASWEVIQGGCTAVQIPDPRKPPHWSNYPARGITDQRASYKHPQVVRLSRAYH